MRSSKWDASPVTSTDSKTHLPKSITFARVTAWGNAPQMNKPSRSVQPTIDSDGRRFSASTRTRKNSAKSTEPKSNFWRTLMLELLWKIFSWEAICIFAITLILVVTLSGCSVHTFAELGDTSYSASISLEAEKYESID